MFSETSEILDSQMHKQASQQTVFGEPIETQGKTLIPISQEAEKSGFKGILKLLGPTQKLLGFLEVSNKKTRYIQTHDRQKISWILGLALLSLILLMIGLRIRKQQRAKRLSLW